MCDGMRRCGALREPSDAREDLISALGPDEGLRIGVMRLDELVNRGLELGDTAEGDAADLLDGEFGKPPFHEADPRAVGRREGTWKRGRLANQRRINAVLCGL